MSVNEIQKEQETSDADKSKSSQKTKKELFKSLDKLRSEINSLRNDLNNINNKKESWFQKKEEMSREIRKNIGAIKENGSKRDSLTKNVKDLKSRFIVLVR